MGHYAYEVLLVLILMPILLYFFVRNILNAGLLLVTEQCSIVTFPKVQHLSSSPTGAEVFIYSLSAAPFQNILETITLSFYHTAIFNSYRYTEMISNHS